MEALDMDSLCALTCYLKVDLHVCYPLVKDWNPNWTTTAYWWDCHLGNNWNSLQKTIFFVVVMNISDGRQSCSISVLTPCVGSKICYVKVYLEGKFLFFVCFAGLVGEIDRLRPENFSKKNLPVFSSSKQGNLNLKQGFFFGENTHIFTF